MKQKLFGRKSFRLSDHEPPYTSLLRVCDHVGLNGFDLEGKEAHSPQPVNDSYSWLVAMVSEELISGQQSLRAIITEEPPVPMHISPLRSAVNVNSKQAAYWLRKDQNERYTNQLRSDIERFIGINRPLDKLYVDGQLSIAGVLHSDDSRSLGPRRIGTRQLWLIAALRSHDPIVRKRMSQRLLEAVEPKELWTLLQKVYTEREAARSLLEN